MKDKDSSFLSCSDETGRTSVEAVAVSGAAPQGTGSEFVFLLREEAADELLRIALYGDRGNSAGMRASIQTVIEAVQQDAYANGRRDEQEELSSVLPGVTYMDPPDGGSPTILEQLQRQAKDARRYLWLRNKIDERHDFYADVPRWSISQERHGLGRCYSGLELDKAVDGAMALETTSQGAAVDSART